MNLSDLLKDLLRPRIAEDAALDIDIDRLAGEVRMPMAARDGIWRESSFELQRGLEVSEEPLESMPAELIDVFRKA